MEKLNNMLEVTELYIAQLRCAYLQACDLSAMFLIAYQKVRKPDAILKATE